MAQAVLSALERAFVCLDRPWLDEESQAFRVELHAAGLGAKPKRYTVERGTPGYSLIRGEGLFLSIASREHREIAEKIAALLNEEEAK